MAASRNELATAARHRSLAAARTASSQIAIAKMSLAVREVSVEKGYDPRDFVLVASGGAGPLHAAADRARTSYPAGDRAALPRPLLRVGHAADGPASRPGADDLRAADQLEHRFRDFGQSYDGDGGASSRRAARRRERPRDRARSSTCATSGQEFTLPVPVASRRTRGRGLRQFAPRSMRFTSAATAITPRPSAPRSSTCGSRVGAPGERAELVAAPRLGNGPPARDRNALGPFRSGRRAVECADLSRAKDLPPGAESRDRRSSRNTHRRPCSLPGDRSSRVAASLENCDRRSGPQRMTSHHHAARPSHARGDPQRAAGDRRRDGRRSPAHLLQHDDLRGRRLLLRAGRAGRRPAFRRTSAASRISSPTSAWSSWTRSSTTEPTASRRATCIITNHQAVAGQHLNNVVRLGPGVLRGQTAASRSFAPTGSTSADMQHRLRRRAARSAIPWMEGLQLDQLKIHEAGEAKRDAVSDARATTSAIPEASLGDLRSQIAACQLGARRWTSSTQSYGAEIVAAGDRTDLRRVRAANAATSWRRSPTACTRRQRSSTTTGARRVSRSASTLASPSPGAT